MGGTSPQLVLGTDLIDGLGWADGPLEPSPCPATTTASTSTTATTTSTTSTTATTATTTAASATTASAAPVGATTPPADAPGQRVAYIVTGDAAAHEEVSLLRARGWEA